MVIFVTGATGFVGGHVVDALLGTGHAVRALVRPGSEGRLRQPGVELVRGSIERDDSYGEALRGVEAVVHLASKTIDHDGTGFGQTNVEGTGKLAAAAARHGVRSFVYLSSTGVYGHGSFVDADEGQPLAPDTPLSRSRHQAEALLSARQGDFALTILRPRFLYGPGDRHFIPRLASALRRRRVLPVSGRARLSLVHAADLAQVIVRCCGSERRAAPAVYHVNDGRPHTIGSLFGAIASATGAPAPRFVPLPPSLLYYPMRAYELLARADPEDPRRSVTSLRLRFLTQHNAFSNRALRAKFPDLRFRELEVEP